MYILNNNQLSLPKLLFLVCNHANISNLTSHILFKIIVFNAKKINKLLISVYLECMLIAQIDHQKSKILLLTIKI